MWWGKKSKSGFVGGTYKYMGNTVAAQSAIKLGLWYALQIISISYVVWAISQWPSFSLAIAGPAPLDQVYSLKNGNPPRTPSIYATDTWSGRMGEAKYKSRDANDYKRGSKVQNAKCKVQNGSAITCECGCDTFLYPPPTFLISSFSPSPTFVSPSQLGVLRVSTRRPPKRARQCSNGNFARRSPNRARLCPNGNSAWLK